MFSLLTVNKVISTWEAPWVLWTELGERRGRLPPHKDTRNNMESSNTFIPLGVHLRPFWATAQSCIAHDLRLPRTRVFCALDVPVLSSPPFPHLFTYILQANSGFREVETAATNPEVSNLNELGL